MTRMSSVPTLDPVESFRSLRVALSVLSSDGQMHRVPSSDVATNHTLVSDVLPDFPPQIGFNFHHP